jgi:L-asparaginase II
MLRAGLDLPPDLLALVTASHNGEPAHVDAVRRILAGAGLPEAALQNTPDLPLHQPSARAHLVAGGEPDPIHQNCSGKHAGMLATCVAGGWPTESYLDPDHPLQVAIRRTVEELAGESVAAVGVDGCGAPLLALSLRGLARAFATLVLARPGSPERAVADAMRAHPFLVGGSGRDVTALMSGLPGTLAKDGAEGVYAAALADGAAVALKIDDGASRARAPVLVSALRRLGAQAPVLDDLAETPVLGHGAPVGSTRALSRLR